MHVCIHVQYTHGHTFIYTQMHITFLLAFVFVRVQERGPLDQDDGGAVCMYVYAYAYAYAYVYVCICEYVCMCICI